MECRKTKNLAQCTCSYEPCERKGICCLCIAHHRANNEMPACYFPPRVEKTYDRSIEKFIAAYRS